MCSSDLFALLREFQASAGASGYPPNFLVYPDANNAGCTLHTKDGAVYEAPGGGCPKPMTESCFFDAPVGHTVWMGEKQTQRFKICGMEDWKKRGTV